MINVCLIHYSWAQIRKSYKLYANLKVVEHFKYKDILFMCKYRVLGPFLSSYQYIMELFKSIETCLLCHYPLFCKVKLWTV